MTRVQSACGRVDEPAPGLCPGQEELRFGESNRGGAIGYGRKRDAGKLRPSYIMASDLDSGGDTDLATANDFRSTLP